MLRSQEHKYEKLQNCVDILFSSFSSLPIYESVFATSTSLAVDFSYFCDCIAYRESALSKAKEAGQIADFVKRGNLGEGHAGDMGKLQEAKLSAVHSNPIRSLNS